MSSFEMTCCEEVLLAEIGRPEMKRLDVAKTYTLAMRGSEADSIDWAKVNQAIIDRWSVSALEYIKGLAWSGKAFTPDV